MPCHFSGGDQTEAKAALLVGVRGGEVVIPFIEKTWFFWWILSTLSILRWFHLFSSHIDDSAVRSTRVERKAGTASDEIQSGTASRLST